MTSHQSYKLTRHPVGSLAESWSISWPLMLGLCSGSVMMFVDRLYLAHFSLSTMNAMAIGGLTCFLFLVFPFSICQITEVFAGKYHGEERHHSVGKPIWQIIWVCLASWPILALASRLLAHTLFEAGSLEAKYFVTMLDFSPFFMGSVGIMGFFIGIGNTKVITFVTILSNLVNIILAPLFIFGTALTPALGITGAAIATGLAQGFQALVLMSLFLKKRYRDKFHTQKVTFEMPLLQEMLDLSVPQALGRLVEVSAFVIFMRIMALAGVNELTCATIVQSFYLLAIFCIDGIAKGVTTIISNLVGAKKEELIPKALYSGLKVHAVVTLVMTVISFSFCELIFSNIMHDHERALLDDPTFSFSLKLTIGWMCLFFLFDGLAWITSGHLLALGESKYIMYVTSSVHWLTYVLPTYLLVTYADCGAATGWCLLVIDGIAMFILFRYRSSRMLSLASTEEEAIL